MAITTKGRSEELKEAKKKIIKLNPMGKTAQKEAAKKNLPEKKFNAKALMESVQDKNTPMKKARLEDSVRGKKMVFAKSGGRIGLKFGGPKPLETKMDKKKIDQTKNVKRLMTKSDAYDPEKRYIKGTRRRGDGGTTNFIKTTTDQTNLREAIKKAKKDNPGFDVRVLRPEDLPRKKVKMASGGRAGFKAGSKCKLAMKGKGRAYGKNS